MISQWLGIEYAKRIGTLVLGATAPSNPVDNTTGHAVSRTAEAEALMTNPPTDPQEGIKAMLLTVYSPAWIAAHPEMIQSILQATPIPEYAARLHALAVKGHDAWDLLPTMSAPTLVIHGSEDQRVPTANAFLLASLIPGAELSIIKGANDEDTIQSRPTSRDERAAGSCWVALVVVSMAIFLDTVAVSIVNAEVIVI